MMNAKTLTHNPKDAETRQRVIEIFLAMKKYGKPNLADIARQVGVTRQRVFQIVEEEGLNKTK